MRGISRLEEKCRGISSCRSSPGSSPGKEMAVRGKWRGISSSESSISRWSPAKIDRGEAGVLGNSTDSFGEACVLGNRKKRFHKKFINYGSPEQALPPN